jgi:hypothetical protein
LLKNVRVPGLVNLECFSAVRADDVMHGNHTINQTFGKLSRAELLQVTSNEWPRSVNSRELLIATFFVAISSYHASTNGRSKT